MKLKISIPIERHGGRIPFVRFKAGDGGEYVALLDTGASTSLLDKTLMEELAAHGRRPVMNSREVEGYALVVLAQLKAADIEEGERRRWRAFPFFSSLIS